MPEQQRLTGDEYFEFDGMPQPVLVSDFWSWAMSRLIMDGPRGDLAEFIVRTALNEDTDIPKRGWGECDIVYGDVRIEVKCSSYLQEWERNTLSKPVFSIGKTTSCDIAVEDGLYRYVGRDGTSPKRRSDVYVFCLFSHTERESANPLQLEQWDFWVASTSIINDVMGDRKTISISGMNKIGAVKCNYYELQREVNNIAQSAQQMLPPSPK